jgi:uncharacterized protein (DUF1501 family)
MSSDPEFPEILRALSVPEPPTRATLSRRRFLAGTALGAAGLLAAPALLRSSEEREAWAAPPIGPTDGILVLVMLAGGNDVLNTVVKVGDPTYVAARPTIALKAEEVHPLSGGLGLHPSLSFLAGEFAAERLAIVPAAGYTPPNLSHFSSTKLWFTGTGSETGATGWLGRWLDGLPGNGDVFRAVTMGSTIPLSLVGAQRRATGLGLSALDRGLGADAQALASYVTVGRFAEGRTAGLTSAVTKAFKSVNDVTTASAPLYAAPTAGSSISRQLTIAARLLNADLGVRVVNTVYGGFDTHVNQFADHGARLKELDDALAGFFQLLHPRFLDRVTVAVFSEFGRTVGENGSFGTDHGAAGAMFVLGHNVDGGVYGAHPLDTGRDAHGRMKMDVDFRSVWSNVLERWLAADAQAVLGHRYPALELFRRGPGTPEPVRMRPAYESSTPIRVHDSRDGAGPLAPGESRVLTLAGARGVPAGVTAVSLNVTVASATAPGHLTVYPGGRERPATSNLNFRPGAVVPNAVILPVGPAGDVVLGNSDGATNVVVDVLGWFVPEPVRPEAVGFAPVTPVRVCDSRDGVGLRRALGPRESAALRVAGTAGVPAGADSVVLNVTVTDTTAPGFLTVWDAGSPRPLASSLNWQRGDTVPNLVIAPVGTDGEILIYNSAGNTQVVVDVFGYFAEGRTATFTVAGPRRIADTRVGLGMRGGRVRAGDVVDLPIAGVGGVPAGAANAVVMNVTAVDPTAASFVTAWPAGSRRPWVSNLNLVPGRTSANLVVVALSDSGSVSLLNSAGSTDLVIDLLGWFGQAPG